MSKIVSAIISSCFKYKKNIPTPNMKELLDECKDEDLNDYSSIGTPVWVAIQYRRPDILEMLLSKGAKMDVPYNQKSILALACEYPGYSQMVKTLLHYGYDILNDQSLIPPICVAAEFENYDALKILIDNGMNPNILDFNLNSVFTYALSLKMFKTLENCGGVPYRFRTILDKLLWAMTQEKVAILKYVIQKYNPDINETDGYDRSYLDRAIEYYGIVPSQEQINGITILITSGLEPKFIIPHVCNMKNIITPGIIMRKDIRNDLITTLDITPLPTDVNHLISDFALGERIEI